MNEIIVQTKSRTDFIDITTDVQRVVETQGISNGILTVFVPHTTAAVTINENADPDVMTDIKTVLGRIVPWSSGYHHSEGNTAAHVKASFMGSSAQLIVENGKLVLGTWQGLFFCEFDGPRIRQVWLKEQP